MAETGRGEAGIVGGLHAVRAALAHDQGIEGLWFDPHRRDRRLRALLARARERGLHPQPLDAVALDRLTGGLNHQGIAARTRLPRALGEADLDGLLEGIQGPPLLLVLDGVQDPHNLGACLRSADGAGAHAVIAPRDGAVGLTPVVSKVASGAVGRVPFVQVTNLARTLRALKARGIWLVGTADRAAQSLYATDLQGPLALVLGGEAQGLRRLTRELCDQLASLPMRGAVESLNVSVAAGICLYEAVRQRNLAARQGSNP